VVFAFLLGRQQLAAATDQPCGGGGRTDHECAVWFEQFTAAGDESQARPAERAEPHRRVQAVDQPGGAEQVPGQWLEVFFGLYQAIDSANDPFESIEADSVAGAARWQFVDAEQPDAAAELDVPLYDRLLEPSATHNGVLSPLAKHAVD